MRVIGGGGAGVPLGLEEGVGGGGCVCGREGEGEGKGEREVVLFEVGSGEAMVGWGVDASIRKRILSGECGSGIGVCGLG